MPDIRHEIDDIREAIEAAIDHRQANTWTTVVAKVVEAGPGGRAGHGTRLLGPLLAARARARETAE